MKRLILVLAVLASCQNPNQAKDQRFFNMCPPGEACLAPYFAVNRLRHSIYVRWNGKRFVMANEADAGAIQLEPDNIIDFWETPQYVVATPGPDSANGRYIRPTLPAKPSS